MAKLISVFSILLIPFLVSGQLELGGAKSKVNFREGPGLNFKIISSLDSSNLLIILPRQEINGFVEVYDIESNSHGFVHKGLILVTDTLLCQKQKFFKIEAESSSGEIEIVLVNKTQHALFVWLNNHIYNLRAREKKSIIIEENNIKYLCSSPGLFPLFGEEILDFGNVYRFDFSL
jgi:hypothetical protein